MTWIKNLILISFSMFFCYGILIVGDWLIQRQTSQMMERNIEYSQAQSIVAERSRSEDIPQRTKAILEGFSPIIYTRMFDTLNLQYPLIAGQPLTKTYYCNEGYGLVKYRSDRFGFRNEDWLWDSKPRNIMIGDSFVHGACVSDDSTLPNRISEKLGENVLNLGLGGNNPSHYYTYASLFIPVLKPTVVYLNFYPNDNGEINISAIERAYVSRKKQFFSESKLALFDINVFKREGDKALNLIAAKKNKPYDTIRKPLVSRAYKAFSRHIKLPNITGILSQNTRGFYMTERVISLTNDLCYVHECKVVVSFIPNSEYYQPDARAHNYGDQIANLTKKLGLKFVDGRNFLDRTKGSKDFAIKGPHLSPRGYKKMAHEIASH